MTEPARPLFWARLSVRHTKKTFFPICLVPILAVLLLIVLKLFKMNENGGDAFTIRGDLRTRLDDARRAARKDHRFDLNPGQADRLQSREDETLILLMRSTRSGTGKSARPATVDVSKRGTNNILSREGLAFLKAAEDKFYASPGFENYCLKEPEAVKDCDGKPIGCAFPESITNHPNLYGLWDKERLCGRKNGSEPVSVDDFNRFAWTLFMNKSTERVVNPLFSVFMGSDFNAKFGNTQVLRSFVKSGAPISNSTKEDFETWSEAVARDLGKTSTSAYHMVVVGGFFFNGINSIVYRDLALALVSIVLVFFVMWVHTTSLLLAGVALLQIILSFPLTYFIYRAIFQIKYFAALQIMTIFLILGIGADDVFVFTDAWKQSGVVLGARSPLEERMSWTYRRAVKAMGVTSFTTAAAFFSTAVSPIMPISTLGVWAGLLVLLQFVLVITMFPCAIIVWHRFWRMRRISNCFKSPVVDESFTTATSSRATSSRPTDSQSASERDLREVPVDAGSVAEWEGPEYRERRSSEYAAAAAQSRVSGDIPHVEDSSGFIRQHGASVDLGSRISVELGHEQRRGCFGKRSEEELRPIEKFFNGPWTALLRMIRYPTIVLAVVLIAVSIYLATRLRPPVEQEGFLPQNHPIIVVENILEKAFPARDGFRNINVNIVWGIKNIDRSGTSKYELDNIGKAVLDNEFSLKTVEAQQHILNACEYFETEQKALIANLPTVEETECWIRDFKKWRGNFTDYNSDREVARELLRFGNHTDQFGRQPYMQHLVNQRVAFSSGFEKPVFTEISFVSSSEGASSYVKLLPEYRKWVSAVETLNGRTTVGSVKNAFATGGGSWQWMMTQKALVDNMFLGIGVVLAVALVALTVSTGNWIVSLLALVCVAGILTNLLALLFLLGWELGITESIGVVIAVGFSFDFVAHLGNAYVETEEFTKLERTRGALTDLGISILFGAISTLLAGAMLFFATIIFFFKFGVFVFSTVALSLVWGLVFFPCMLLVFGPTGATGQIMQVFRGVQKCFGFGGGKRSGNNEGVTVLDEV